MSIGERISSLRKEKNISQYQLAKHFGVTRQAVSKWESDQSTPDMLNLIQLADFLDTEVEYLATGRFSQSPSPSDLAPKIVEVEKTVEVERIVEKKVLVEKPIYIEKVVETEKIIEKPVIKKVFRYRYVRNPIEYVILALISFGIGIFLGLLF